MTMLNILYRSTYIVDFHLQIVPIFAQTLRNKITLYACATNGVDPIDRF